MVRSVTSDGDGSRMTVFIESDIDHHNAVKLRAEIDRLIETYKPRELTLDFDSVEFMDSSGIGLMIGRYKLVNAYGGRLCVENLNRRCERLTAMSGVLGIIKNKGQVEQQ
ncbi:MAG: anti-sigma factor antagonist [Oscillospiraceae bacterium]